MSNESDSSSLDLNSALREAFAEQAAREEAEGKALASVIGAEAKEQDAPEAKAGAQETASAEAESIKAVEPQKEAIEPPSHWSEEHKELFRRQSPEAQQFVLERHKAMEGDYTRKAQEIAEQRKQFESIQQAIEPYRPMLAARGISEQQALRTLFEAQRRLDTDPNSALAELARSYGVAFAPPAESTGFVDPEVDSLKQQLTKLQQDLALRDQREQAARQQTLQQTIDEFRYAKDAKGEPLHPHYEKVRAQMGGLLYSGAAKDMDDAYQQAVYANADLRSQLLEAERKAAAEKARAEALKAAEDAKKKVVPVGKGATVTSEKEPTTLREQLKAEYRKAMTGTRI